MTTEEPATSHTHDADVEEGMGAPLLPSHAKIMLTGTQQRQETTGAQQPFTVYEVEVYTTNDNEDEGTNNNTEHENTDNNKDSSNNNDDNIFCIVYRRFREFYSLYTELVNEYPDTFKNTSFPYRRLWGNMDPEIIAYRSKELDQFLKYCMEHDTVRSSPCFRKFLHPDTTMLRHALDYFRSRLCSLRETKEDSMTEEKRNETIKCERHVRYLSRALQEAAREASFVVPQQKTKE